LLSIAAYLVYLKTPKFLGKQRGRIRRQLATARVNLLSIYQWRQNSGPATSAIPATKMRKPRKDKVRWEEL
jgi:hypothetical protein